MPLDITKPEIQTLISSLNKRKAFVIAGAGVSSASIDSDSRKMFGTWTNLLHYGITFCCDKCRTDATWEDSCRASLDNKHATTEELLKIGDEIWDYLEVHGKVQEWLDIFDRALLDYRELIIAIKALGVPIATANYDNLLEDITHLTPITLQETQKVEDFIKNDQKQKYILHLHGYYKKPESIVLGQKSYDKIVQNDYAQFINRYLTTAYDAVIFVGFGQGVYDQNFSLIFQWVSKYLNKTKLYHIVLDKYVDETKETHQKNGNPNVVVLGYGVNYDELTPYINDLAHNIEHDDDLPKTLEGKPTCIGQNRLDLVEEVALYLSKNYKKPAGILGTGGLGKTNLVLNVLHHRAIARKYRRNRFFVRCDGAKHLSLLQNTLVNALEMPVGTGDLGDRILNYLSHQDNRFLIALDNFETTWEDKNNVEPYIEKLKDHADLVFTYRGNASPDELDWETFKVPFLNEADAITLFNKKSEKKFVGNTLVKTMVNDVSYLPLAIELLAKRAKKVEKLEDLYREWQKKSNEFLSKGLHKKENLNLSISFSYENTRLSDANRTFLQALSYLPHGMNRQDLETIFDDAYDQIEILKDVGLCEETDQTRLWMLAPIREYVKQKTTPDNPLIAQIQDFYLDLAKEKGENIGYKEGITQILNEEWNNIIKVITDTLETRKGISSLHSLRLYCQFSGFYPIDLLNRAIKITSINDWKFEKANSLKILGDFSVCNTDHINGNYYYEQALSLYIENKYVSEQAVCFLRIGEILYRQSNYDMAKDYCQRALSSFVQIDFLLGKACSLKQLGDIATRQHENSLANNHYHQALILFDKIEDSLSQANCYRRLGDLMYNQFENQLAENYYKLAINIFNKIGDLLGKANCLKGLGYLSIRKLQYEIADNLFNQSLNLYDNLGDLLGYADSIRGCGEIAFCESNFMDGNTLYKKSIDLYQKVNDPYSIGWAYYLWSFNDDRKKKEYQCMAKKVWLGAKLNYLVVQFGLTDLECD